MGAVVVTERDELRKKVAEAVETELALYDEGDTVDYGAIADRILALLPPQPKLEWRDDELFLAGLLVGSVMCTEEQDPDWYGYVGDRLDDTFWSREGAQGAVETAVRKALGWPE